MPETVQEEGSGARVRLWLLLLTFASYLPVLWAGLVLDDDHLVFNNPHMSAGLPGLWRIWAGDHVADYWPLTYSAFWVQTQLWGDFAPLYHLVNLGLHAASACLLWGILKRLAVPGALFAAAVFSVHPTMVESVAWISELKNVLSGLFFLLSIRAFLPFLESGARRSCARCLAFFLLALLSKTSTVMLPLVLLLLLLWRRRRLELRRDVLPLAPFFLLAAVFAAVTVWFQTERVGASGPAWALEPEERFVVAEKAIWFYLGRLLWPDVCFSYPRFETEPTGAAVLAGLAVPALAFSLWRLREWIGFGVFFAWAYFLALLFPVMGFFKTYYSRYSFVADRWQYLAAIGPIALFAAGAAQGLRGLRAARASRPLGLLLLLPLSATTWTESLKFRDSEALWRATLEKNAGSWFAWNGLGFAMGLQDNLPEAERHFREALRIQPLFLEARNNLGMTLGLLGKRAEAEAEWRHCLRLDPEFPQANLQLAEYLLEEGRFAEAGQHFRRGLKKLPYHPVARNNLGNLLAIEKRWEEAIAEYRVALEVAPRYAEAGYNLSKVLAETGRFGEAVREGRQAAENARAQGREDLAREIDQAVEAYLRRAPTLMPR